MAHLYQRTFGNRIEGNAPCSGWGNRFEFDFEPAALLSAVVPVSAVADANGWFTDSGNRFRLPASAADAFAQLRAAQAVDLPPVV